MKRMADAIELARDLGVEIADGWKLPDLQRAVVKKAGHRMADSLTGEALAAAVEGVRVSRPAPNAWNEGWNRTLPTNPTQSGSPLTQV